MDSRFVKLSGNIDWKSPGRIDVTWQKGASFSASASGCSKDIIDARLVLIVLPKDFEKGYKNNIKKDETEHEFYK